MNDNQNPGGTGGLNPDDFEAFMRQFLSGDNRIDPEQLAEAAGLPKDPAAMAAMLDQIKQVMSSLQAQGGTLASGASGVNWELATSQAKALARSGSLTISGEARKQISDAVAIGTLWLNEATTIPELIGEPKLLSRELWVADAMPLFQALSEPVANRMSEALSENLTQNAPEEIQEILGNASGVMKSAGGALFAMQLGQALGKLSHEVLTGGDIGLPLFKDQRAAFVAQNLEAFVNGLEIERDQAYIYLVIREMAHVACSSTASGFAMRWFRKSQNTRLKFLLIIHESQKLPKILIPSTSMNFAQLCNRVHLLQIAPKTKQRH